MTALAPSPATSSTLRPLHTPVTSAPCSAASCTVSDPIPPDAPFTSTLAPASDPRTRRSACSAVKPAIGIAAAASSSTASGIATACCSFMTTASAHAPRLTSATTRSPTATDVTPSPTAATTPATSLPMIAGGFGAPRPETSRIAVGSPRMKCQSAGLIAATAISTST